MEKQLLNFYITLPMDKIELVKAIRWCFGKTTDRTEAAFYSINFKIV